MSGTVMMAIEGVLGETDEFAVNMMPSKNGLGLYVSLSQQYRMVLVTSHVQAEPVEWWLRNQGFHDYAMVMCSLLGEESTHADERAAQLRALRASRTDVALVIDSDPQAVVSAMAAGITGLLYGRPRPASGRTDLGARRIRDWSAIEEEMEARR